MTKQERIHKFDSTILTTDEELLDLLPTEQLENRLRILRSNTNTPLRYRVVLVRLLAQRSAS